VKIMVRIACLLLGLLLCAAFLAACNNSPSGQSSATATPASAFQTSSKTSDGALVVQMKITPAHLGENQFTVTATNASNGQTVTQANVTLFTTMLTMDMGTDNVPMQSDGKGHFTANGLLTMSGRWEVRVAVRTPDNVLHEAKVQFTVAA
jgi:copper transport protein